MNEYQPSFFDGAERYKKLDKLKDPLVELKGMVDFELFRAVLERVFEKPRSSKVGRKAMDVVFMFKILILQRLYNLSDEQVEFQINDRHSFCRFLGIPLGGTAPDFTTVWKFREALVKADVVRELFGLYEKILGEQGWITREGSIVDASFVEVPKQRNTREENELVKGGTVPEEWGENPRKLSQKDMDARWAKKNDISYYGYKDHVKVDVQSKLITNYEVTDASVHDSRMLADLVDESSKGEKLFADSAYCGKEHARRLDEIGVENLIHQKGYRNKALPEKAKQLNSLKSSIRCRVEHVFGFIENSMGGGSRLRYIGIKRIAAAVGLLNLAYNLKRFIILSKQESASMA